MSIVNTSLARSSRTGFFVMQYIFKNKKKNYMSIWSICLYDLYVTMSMEYFENEDKTLDYSQATQKRLRTIHLLCMLLEVSTCLPWPGPEK